MLSARKQSAAFHYDLLNTHYVLTPVDASQKKGVGQADYQQLSVMAASVQYGATLQAKCAVAVSEQLRVEAQGVERCTAL